MNNVKLHSYGRKKVNGRWEIDVKRSLNRLYYVNSGTATVQTALYRHTLTEGRLYLIPECRSYSPVDSFDFDHTYFDFYSSRILSPDSIIEISDKLAEGEAFFTFVNRMLELIPDRSAQIKAMERHLCGFLSTIDTDDAPLPYVTNSFVTRAVDAIHRSCATVSTESLALERRINESYFIRIFRAAMGISPGKYIRACRAMYGKELLECGHSVNEASELCGYSSPSAFFKAIKTELHTTPSSIKLKR